MPERRRGRAAKRALAAGCVAAVGAGTGVGIWQADAAGAPAYRTAAATTASVNRTLAVTGTLEPASEAQTEFQVSGTVASVGVKQGQQVTAGQTLAALDPTLLQSRVNAAQAALTAAQAKLSADESGQVTAAAGSAAVPSTAASTTSADLAGPGPGIIVLASTTASTRPSTPAAPTGGSGSLAGAQQAVVAAQHAADTDLQTADADLAQVAGACGTGPAPGPRGRTPSGPTTTTTGPTTTTTGPTTTTTGPTTTTTGPTTTAGPSTPAPGSGPDACAAALAQAEGAQQKVGTDQASLASAEADLAKLLSSGAPSSGPAPGSSAGAAPPPAGGGASTRKTTTGGSSAGSGAGSGSSSGTARPTGTPSPQPTDTPEQLASDQAAIDSDEASLAEVQESLTATVLTSPIAGTVASVGITPGQTVGAGSSSAAVTVIGSNGYVTTTSLTTSQVQEVKLGDRATLSVDGTAGTLEGTVSSIGPVDATNSSYTYPVIIAITSTAGGLAAGSATRIQIDVAGVHDVLAVPTSAVHTNATGTSFVYLVNAGKETARRVTVGVVGPVYTQVSSGLLPGQAVVLADPSQPVPASSTNLTTRGGGLGRFLGGGAATGGALRNVLRRSAG